MSEISDGLLPAVTVKLFLWGSVINAVSRQLQIGAAALGEETDGERLSFEL